MLHNTGTYAPNEAPINMGAPMNVSQLSSSMNMVQNMSNLEKPVQPSPQAAAGHFGLPIYPSYTSSSPNIGPQMNMFPNYHASSYQPNYMPQSSSLMPNLNWQNGMLPMNLNMYSEHAQNMSNHPPTDRRTPDSDNDIKVPSYTSKVPFNPQVPNFSRHVDVENNDEAVVSSSYKAFDNDRDNTTSKPHEILLHDNNRRKNLENTVRLIENILINTTKNREKQLENEAKKNEAENYKTVPKNEDIDPDEIPVVVEAISRVKDKTDSVNKSPKDENTKTTQNEDDSEEMTEHRIDIDIKLEPEDDMEPMEVREVEVKIEPIINWMDTEQTTPFHRDANRVQDDIDCAHVIESGYSVAEASRIVANKEDTDNCFECPYCSLLFKHPKRFLIHTKWHTFGLINEKRIEMAKEKKMKYHQRNVARKIKKGPAQPQKTEKAPAQARKPWPCKDCDKIFHARGGLESHRKRYHTNIVRECKMCGKTITGWGPWKTHLATHNTESGYQCPHCPKRFKYTHSLSKHKDTHLEKTHACAECPKKFGSQTLLKVHMKSHERAQRGATFHCSFCGKPFFDKFNLQIHERTHTNERPFVCEICNSAYGCNSNLSRHMKVSHSASKPYECSTCHRCFTTERIRDRHEMRLHGDPEEFKYVCKQCPSRYMKASELRKHTYKTHPKSKSKKGADTEDSQ